MKKIANVYQRKDARGLFVECYNSLTTWKAINGGTMKKGAVLGNHYHKKTDVLFFLLSGSAEITMRDVRKKKSGVSTDTLRPYEGVIFKPFETHAIRFLARSTFLLLKTKKYSPTDMDIYTAPVQQ